MGTIRIERKLGKEKIGSQKERGRRSMRSNRKYRGKLRVNENKTKEGRGRGRRSRGRVEYNGKGGDVGNR